MFMFRTILLWSPEILTPKQAKFWSSGIHESCLGHGKFCIQPIHESCPKYFPIRKRRSEYGIPIQNRRSTGVIVVSGGGLHPTHTDMILCLLCMFVFYLQYCRKKPFSSLKLDPRRDLTSNAKQCVRQA